MSFLMQVSRDRLASQIAEHRDLCARGDLATYDARLREIGLSAVVLDALEEEEREYEAKALGVAAIGLDPLAGFEVGKDVA